MGGASVTASWTLPGLPGEEQIATLSWMLTHPGEAGMRMQSGTVAVSSDPATFLLGSLEPSASYTISVSGTSTDGATICTSSTGLKIQPNQTTNVSMTLACMPSSPDAGYAQVNGATFNCGTLSSVSVLPAEVRVGFSVAVSASATGPDPSSVTYAWSAPSGAFSAPASASTTFTCTAAGVVPLTLQIGDGPLPDGSACDPARSTATVSVICD
jgi:hypothetical protein